MKEFLPYAYVALPTLSVVPIIFLAIWQKISSKRAAFLLILPSAVSAILYVLLLQEQSWAGIVIFILCLICFEYGLFKAVSGMDELLKPSSQFDLINDKLKKS